MNPGLPGTVYSRAETSPLVTTLTPTHDSVVPVEVMVDPTCVNPEATLASPALPEQ